MTVVTTTYEAELASNQPTNMFKALGGLIYTAAMTVAIPAAFTTATTADLVQLPAADWTRLGLLTKSDGLKFARAMKNDTEESWGYEEATREDITSDVTSAQFTLQEQNRATLEMYDFVDLSAVVPDAVTGEVAYNKPIMSATSFRRIIYLAVDGAGVDRRYRIKVMPKAQVTAVGDEVWQQANATNFPFTITAKIDPVLGYSVRNILAGPGQKARNSLARFGA
jgi:hypothetical protein